MDLLGNKSLETHSTRSENSLKKNLVSKIFRVSKITTLFFCGGVINWTVCFPNNKENKNLRFKK